MTLIFDNISFIMGADKSFICLDHRTILNKRVMIMKPRSKTCTNFVQGLTSMVVLSIGAPTNPPRSLSTVEFNLIFLYMFSVAFDFLNVNIWNLNVYSHNLSRISPPHQVVYKESTSNSSCWSLGAFRLGREADLVTAQERKLLMSTIYWDGRKGEEL